MRRIAIRLVLLFSVVSTVAIVFQNCAKKSSDYVVQSSSGTGPAASGLSTDGVNFTDSNAENGSSFYTDFTSVEGSEKRCGVSFATFGQSVYEPSQSIGIRIKTSFPLQSNYVIEWASGDGDSPQGYDKSSELSSLKSAMSGLEAFTYLDFKVSYSLPGTYQRILRIKDASGNKLCDSNGSSPLILTISPNKCDLGLTAASFPKGTDVSFTLKSSATLPTDFSVRWTDNKNNSVGDDTSLKSDISSQRENMSSGIALIRQFSEVKTFTRAIEIKSGNDIWCISNPKEFATTEPVPLPTGGTAGTGSGSGTGSTGGSGGTTTPPPVIESPGFEKDFFCVAGNNSSNTCQTDLSSEISKAGLPADTLLVIDLSQSYVNWMSNGPDNGCNPRDAYSCSGNIWIDSGRQVPTANSSPVHGNIFSLQASQIYISVHIHFNVGKTASEQKMVAYPLHTHAPEVYGLSADQMLRFGNNMKKVSACNYNGEILNGGDVRDKDGANECKYAPLSSTYLTLLKDGKINQTYNPDNGFMDKDGYVVLKTIRRFQCLFIAPSNDVNGVWELRDLGYVFQVDGSSTSGMCGQVEQAPYQYIPDGGGG